MKFSYVYILVCADNTYYTGVTSNLDKRLKEHKSGKYKTSYTFRRRPVELVYYKKFSNIETAFEKEKQIKKWSRTKKKALINGDYNLLRIRSKKEFKK